MKTSDQPMDLRVRRTLKLLWELRCANQPAMRCSGCLLQTRENRPSRRPIVGKMVGKQKLPAPFGNRESS
jgi:hypothetical protein